MSRELRKGHIVIFSAFVFLLLIFAYSNTLKGEFQFDDDISVIENYYVKEPSRFSCSDFISGAWSGIRPVTTATFALNYKLGGLDVRLYHLTNLLIHVINGLLVFYLVFITLRSPKLSDTEQNRALSVALFSSAIFLLHPIQTEAVSYISQRYESLASLFYLCSLIAYIKARLTGQKSEENKKTVPAFNAVFWYLTSIISGILALGSKEIAVTIPVSILLYDFYFLSKRPFLNQIIGPGIFILLSIAAGLGIVLNAGRGIDAGFSVRAFTPWEYLLTQFRAVTTYIRLLFVPVNQNLDYDFRISKGLFESDTFLSFIFLVSLVAIALLLFKKWRLGSFFILWFFIVLAPTSSIVPIIDPVFEHRAYLASMGIFVIISDGLSRVLASVEGKNIYRISIFWTAVLLMALLAGTTFQRNKVWQTKLSLWEDIAKKSPMKSRVHNNLGNCYMLLGRHFEAIEEYKKAISIDKNNSEAYYNIGMNLESVGLLKQAIYYYDIFYRIAPAAYDKQKGIVLERMNALYEKTGK